MLTFVNFAEPEFPNHDRLGIHVEIKKIAKKLKKGVDKRERM